MRTLTFNRVIGAGAMGTVYHAELRVPGGFARTCAVKVMKSSAPDHEHFRARMRDEARLLGMLQDELILGVAEMVQVEGRDAVVMEYVEGIDLSEIIKATNVPPRAVAELGAEISATLGRAHAARHPSTGEPLRVIHRDIKPANIMMTTRGGVRVLDFGVARAAFASRESQTQGLVLGTLNYFPPEILAGQDPTPAVDIYGLGLTMWECATAREWGAPRVQRAQFERRVDRRLEELNEDYAPLLPVLRQVLQWDPELRPDGATLEKSLLAALEQCRGSGLRSWGRRVVPELVASRVIKVQDDPLLGRTVELRTMQLDDAGPPKVHARKAAPPAAPTPATAPKRLAQAAPSPTPAGTAGFDDLAPTPAPRAVTPAPAAPRAPIRPAAPPDDEGDLASERPTVVEDEPARGGRGSSKGKGRSRASGGMGAAAMMMWVFVGVALGGAIGLIFLAAMAVVLFLVV